MSLVAQYKLDERTGTVIKDFVGSNDGVWVGTELVTNGDFSAWSGVADPDNEPDNWAVIITGGADGTNKLIDATNKCQLIHDGTPVEDTVQLSQTILTIGKQYTATLEVITATDGGIQMQSAPYTSPDLSTTGVKTWTFVAGATLFSVKRSVGVGSVDITFTDVSVRETVDPISAPPGMGLVFDGVGDYIAIADATIFTPAGTAFSISAWINMTDATGFRIISKGIYNTDGEWRLVTDSSDKLQFLLFDESVDNCWMGRIYNTALTTYEGQWIHLVATYDGGASASGVKLYLNGVQVDDTDSAGETFVVVENLTHAVWIGREVDGYADGNIADVRIYNEILSQARAVQIMQDGLYDRTLRNRIRR